MVEYGHTVEMEIDGVWTDVTRLSNDAKVLGNDGTGAITITRKSRNQYDSGAPTAINLSMIDNDGVLNTENPLSPYYNLLGRNTPIRVKADGSSTQGHGEISEFKPRWQKSGNEHIINLGIEASGITRRLIQGKNVLRTPLSRAMSNENPIAWWPLTDSEGATEAVSAIGGAPMSFNADMRPGQVDGTELLDTAKSPEWCAGDGNTISGIATGTLVGATTGIIAFDLWLYAGFGSTSITNFGGIGLSGTTLPGAGCYFRVLNSGIDPTNQFSFTFALGDQAGSPETVFDQEIIRGQWTHIRCTAKQNGANIDMEIFRDGVSTMTETYVGATLGKPVSITLGGYDTDANALDTLSIRHLMFWDTATPPDVYTPGSGYDGETAADRFERLCTEEEIPVTIIGTAADSELMGPQGVSDLVTLLWECVAVDQGLMYEPKDSLGLVYRVRADLYNQDPAVELDYSSFHLSEPFLPVDDDNAVRNRVTMTREGGASYTYTIEDNDPEHLTTQAPPLGVFAYDESKTVNVYADTQLDDLAEWYAHVRAWKEQRFISVRLQLSRAVLQANPTLSAAIVAADIGDVISIDTTDAPRWISNNPVKLLILGITVVLGKMEWTVTFQTTPAEPYAVGGIGADDGSIDVFGAAYDTDVSTLNEDLDTTETGVDVATTGGIVWTTDSDDWNVSLNGGGLFIEIGGEVMRITNVTGATSPQTLTVVRSVNGIVKAHSTGDPVHVLTPVRIGL